MSAKKYISKRQTENAEIRLIRTEKVWVYEKRREPDRQTDSEESA